MFKGSFSIPSPSPNYFFPQCAIGLVYDTYTGCQPCDYEITTIGGMRILFWFLATCSCLFGNQVTSLQLNGPSVSCNSCGNKLLSTDKKTCLTCPSNGIITNGTCTCPDGMYISNNQLTGLLSCVNCPKGYYPSADLFSCIGCSDSVNMIAQKSNSSNSYTCLCNATNNSTASFLSSPVKNYNQKENGSCLNSNDVATVRASFPTSGQISFNVTKLT